ncbi:MAG: hypothetical protein ACYC99_12655 [Candidatus Geothermincolia bacterium]
MAAAALLAAIIAAGLVAGCSGDEAKARQYIEAARKKNEKVAVSERKLQQKSEELAKFNEVFQNITPETASALKKYFAEVVALHMEINKAAQATRTEYEKILDLNGVADYKKLAKNRIEVSNLLDKRALLVKQFAAIYDQVVDQGLSGQPIDETMVRNQSEQIDRERIQIDKQLEELNSKAVDLAEKLNLD